jgi:hypothetical protein
VNLAGFFYVRRLDVRPQVALLMKVYYDLHHTYKNYELDNTSQCDDLAVPSTLQNIFSLNKV